MNEDGPRLSKLKLAYKKAIQEVLKEERKIREILLDPNTVVEDSFFVSNSKVEESFDEQQSMDEDAINKAVKEIFLGLKSKLSDTFKKKVSEYSIASKLNNLDKEIAKENTYSKSITCNEYIKEIFESYLVDPKLNYIRYIEEAKKESSERIKAANKAMEGINERIRQLKEENALYDKAYDSLTIHLLEAMENKSIIDI
ncbi:hypothetical protein HK407_02g03120 [Ordospora pajunii]|uniref:uncharacterized protein n=1 Tax=Ordospora pajunii TaxID=3039483 RepID=UPI002952628E|nr:uncharacterized protein HK407_02g03120 [Ordospora pajunii]KAH9412088.1 hypothetical protein HK407_02g03120 [Ordospora pajunii]